jgi:DNA-binding NtrC family response regulator
LNVLRIEMPPLRTRGTDIGLLAKHFVGGFAREFKRQAHGLTHGAESLLNGYGWPGNVREMRNLIERAVLMSEADTLHPADFESLHTRAVGVGGGERFELPAEGIALEDVEQSFVMQALDRVGGNQTRAAALLGLHRDQIRYRIEKFGLAKKN